jgi:hypothetical protein
VAYRLEEWAASLLAAAGSLWFVQELTRTYHRAVQILPPTGGPTELIGLAILIWLHAKHRRVLESRTPVLAQLPDVPVTNELLEQLGPK